MKRVGGHDVVLLNGSRSWGHPLIDALLGRVRGNHSVLNALGMCAAALVVAEDEQLVVLDGPAERPAEQILNEHGNGNAGAVVEEIVGIEIPVPQVVERVAVELVGA